MPFVYYVYYTMKTILSHTEYSLSIIQIYRTSIDYKNNSANYIRTYHIFLDYHIQLEYVPSYKYSLLSCILILHLQCMIQNKLINSDEINLIKSVDLTLHQYILQPTIYIYTKCCIYIYWYIPTNQAHLKSS